MSDYIPGGGPGFDEGNFVNWALITDVVDPSSPWLISICKIDEQAGGAWINDSLTGIFMFLNFGTGVITTTGILTAGGLPTNAADGRTSLSCRGRYFVDQTGFPGPPDILIFRDGVLLQQILPDAPGDVYGMANISATGQYIIANYGLVAGPTNIRVWRGG